MKENRKITVELLRSDKTNTYKVLAEFLARKFNEKGFDKEEQKWFNKFATNQGTTVLYKSYKIVKKRRYQKVSPIFFLQPKTVAFLNSNQN